jgi:hypothetical protein
MWSSCSVPVCRDARLDRIQFTGDNALYIP